MSDKQETLLIDKYFEWEIDDKECDPGWTEVAFIPAWQLEEGSDP